jgi:hypothetical protein
MDKKTESILTRDTLSETEKQFGGKHWSKFSDNENKAALLNAVRDNTIKEYHLKSIGDTYFGMPWDDFKNLIKEKGFIQALTYDIDYKGFGRPTKEEVIIHYHSEKGLIIWATSIGDKARVNGGTLYGEIQAKDEDSKKVIWRWMSTGGCIDMENRIYITSHDVREGLFSKLDTLETAGTFLKNWTCRNRFLWFVDYAEDDVEGYDYKKITNEKINRCPKEVQDIIGPREN